MRLCIDSMTSQSSVANSIYFSNKKHSKKKYNFLQMYKCNPTYRFIEKFIIQFSFYIKITPPAKEVTTFPLFLFLSLSVSFCLSLSLPLSSCASSFVKAQRKSQAGPSKKWPSANQGACPLQEPDWPEPGPWTL